MYIQENISKIKEYSDYKIQKCYLIFRIHGDTYTLDEWKQPCHNGVAWINEVNIVIRMTSKMWTSIVVNLSCEMEKWHLFKTQNAGLNFDELLGNSLIEYKDMGR